MKKTTMKYILILLIAAMLFTGCTQQNTNEKPDGPVDLSVDALMLGYSEHFTTLNPFYADTTTNVDMDIVNLTQVFLIDIDDLVVTQMVNSGNVATIEQLTEIHLPTIAPQTSALPTETQVPTATPEAPTPEAPTPEAPTPEAPTPEATENPLLTRYDYEVTYKITIKDNLFTANGQKLTIDDLIFNMYVMCDASYDGQYLFGSLPIKGIDEYRYGFNQDIFMKYAAIAGRIVQVAPDTTDLTPYEGLFTKEQFDNFWQKDFESACNRYMEAIIDHINASRTIDDDDLSGIALAMYKCDLLEVAENGAFVDVCGKEYDMEETIPSMEDFRECIRSEHGYNIDAIDAMYENVSFSAIFIQEFVINQAKINGDVTAENERITGIAKTGEFTMELTLTSYSVADELYFVFPVMPLSHYGDAATYNYENNSFGFTKGDISRIRNFENFPMGAGPYKYEKTADGMIYLTENVYYSGVKNGNVKNVIMYLNNKDDKKYTDPVAGILDGTYDACLVFNGMEGYEELTENDKAGVLTATGYKLVYSKERIEMNSMPLTISDTTTWLRTITNVKMK